MTKLSSDQITELDRVFTAAKRRCESDLAFALFQTSAELEAAFSYARKQHNPAMSDDYCKYFRDALVDWPAPREFLPDNFAERFPLLSEIIGDDPAKFRILLCGAHFANNDPDIYAEIAEGVLTEHVAGAVRVERQAYLFSESRNWPKQYPPPRNRKCFGLQTMCYYTQFAPSIFRELVFPGVQTGGFGGAHSGGGGRCYFEWPNCFFKLTTMSGTLRIKEDGHESVICIDQESSLIDYLYERERRRALVNGRDPKLVYFQDKYLVVVHYSAEERLLEVEQWEKFFGRICPLELQVQGRENPVYLPRPKEGQSAANVLWHELGFEKLHRGGGMSDLIQVLGFDEERNELMIRLRPEASIPIPEDRPSGRWF